MDRMDDESDMGKKKKFEKIQKSKMAAIFHEKIRTTGSIFIRFSINKPYK